MGTSQIANSAREIQSLKKTNVVCTSEYIQRAAFKNCKKLNSVILPTNCKIVNQYAFANSSIVSVVINGKKLEDRVFYNCTKLEEVLFQSYDHYWLENGLFENCENLKTIEIPLRVKVLGTGCFRNCKRLHTVILPPNMEFLHYESFANCKNLQNIKLSGNIKKIGTRTFSNCFKLQEVDIPSSTEQIQSEAFYNCRNLAKVNFKSTRTYFETEAFLGCNQLQATLIISSMPRKHYDNYINLYYKKIKVTPDLEENHKKLLDYIRTFLWRPGLTWVSWENISFTFRTLSGDSYEVNLSENVKSPIDNDLDFDKELVIACAEKMEVGVEEIYLVERKIILYHPTIEVEVTFKNISTGDTITTGILKLITLKGYSSDHQKNLQDCTINDALVQIRKLTNIDFDIQTTVTIINNQNIEDIYTTFEDAWLENDSKFTLLIES